MLRQRQKGAKKRVAVILYVIYFLVLIFSILAIVRLFLVSNKSTRCLDPAFLDVEKSLLANKPPKDFDAAIPDVKKSVGWSHHLTTNHFLPALSSSNGRVCPCCGFVGEKFAEIDGKERLCPVCKARERHRKFCAILHCPPNRGGISWKSGAQPFRLLHFGPQMSMYRLIEAMEPPLEQMGLDFFAPGYSHNRSIVSHADVTNLTFEDQTSDGIVILHVLEHIRELDRALSELRRVLKSSGWIYVEVPCWSLKGNVTVDCRKYTTGEDLTRCAGQFDHVWKFDCSHFSLVLLKNGLACERFEELDSQKECLSPELRSQIKLKHSALSFPSFFCRRGLPTTVV